MTSIDLTRFRVDGETARDIAAATPLRPALLARYLDLAGLRHDFPLVLTDDADRPVVTLTEVMDELLSEMAPRGAEGERLRQHVLRLEAAIRRRLEREPEKVTLLQAWDGAAADLLRQSTDADALRASLATARAALSRDGAMLPCDDRAPAALVRHLRDAVEEPRAATFRDELAEMVRRLDAVLAVDDRRSAAGRDPERLRAAVGTTYEDAFDFEAWSQLLAPRPDDTPLPGPRRTRIEWALEVLRDQRFVAGDDSQPGDTHGFDFDSCARALDAYRDRMPELVRLVKATAIARLELDNAYDPATHDGYFHTFDAAALVPEDLLGFPRHLVVLDGDGLDSATFGQVLDVLASPLPLKIVVVTADAIGPPPLHDPLTPRRLTGVDLAVAAVGLGTARVVQTTLGAMARTSDDIVAALADPGTALVNVVTGSGANVDLPSYLAAAAAAEARAAAIFSHDPNGGPDWADQVTVAHTPQPSADWPMHVLQYEDEQLQRVREDVAFTVADLVAADARFGDHVAVVPRRLWTDAMVPVAEFLGMDASDRDGRVPYVLGVGGDDVLRRVVVDQRVIAVTEQRLATWRRLQELAGVRQAQERRRLAADLAALEAERLEAASAVASAAPPTPAAAATAAPEIAHDQAGDDAHVDGGASDVVEPEQSAEDAWIETARCTTCDECTNLNPRMFAYNDDKQAYIADLGAGSFRDLVQAAESCQVSIIHPGKPWNPDEPGLDDLQRRAAAFT